MSKVISAAAAGAILAGPAVIAFFSGGFYDTPRLVAGLVAAALLLGGALLAERPLPRYWPGRLALGGMAGLTLWSALSVGWAPIGGPAIDDVQRLVLYLLGLAAAAAWLRPVPAARAVEPALALGALCVVGYGLSERMLPGLLEFEASRAADGRLEQPLTYWNGMGAIAVVGIVLCVRLAGSAERTRWLRAAAAAGVPTLAAGLYLTFSRGGLAALAVGILALLALAPERPQVRAAGVSAVAGACALLLATALPEVRTVAGGDGQGAALLAGLLALAVGAGVFQGLLARNEDREKPRPLARRRRWVAIAGAGLAAAVVGGTLLAGGFGGEAQRDRAAQAGPERLRSLGSNRYDYWEVALASLADAPLRGVGTAGFRAEWQRDRELPEVVRDAHSLYLETAAELGIVGLLLLGAVLLGVGASARRALRRDPAAAAGATATLAAWALHAGLDWDWELPGVTLPALALAGLLLASGDRPEDLRA